MKIESADKKYLRNSDFLRPRNNAFQPGSKRLEGWYFTNDPGRHGATCYKYSSGVSGYYNNQWPSKKACKDACMNLLSIDKSVIKGWKETIRKIQSKNFPENFSKQPQKTIENSKNDHPHHSKHDFGTTYDELHLEEPEELSEISKSKKNSIYEKCLKLDQPDKKKCKKRVRKNRKGKDEEVAKEEKTAHQSKLYNQEPSLVSQLETLVDSTTAHDKIWPENVENDYLQDMPNIQMKFNNVFAPRPVKDFSTYENVLKRRPWAPSWTPQQVVGEKCKGGANPGHGGSKIQRYFFNHEKLRCESFIYSGVGGNLNNYL